MRCSAHGLAFISVEEGTILHPYNDSQGYATVFVGHLIGYRPVQAHDWRDWAPLTRAHAIQVLAKDTQTCEAAIARDITVPLNQNEYDALCSLIFNIGTGGFHGSTVRRKLNAGDRRGAADAFLMWRIPSVLLPRRRRERTLFLTPVPKPLPPKEDLSLLQPDEERWVREYDKLPPGGPRKGQLRTLMTKRRKRINRVAQPAPKGDGRGWHVWHRVQRYNILKSRTS